MGLGAMSNGASTAKGIQGVDLFGEQQARIVAGYERSAGYVNPYRQGRLAGGAAPRRAGAPRLARQHVVTRWAGCSTPAAGRWAYSHYADRGGIAMPNTERLAKRLRPIGGAMLHLSWQTLTNARSASGTARGGRRPPGSPSPVGSRKRTSDHLLFEGGDDHHDVEPDRPVLDVEVAVRRCASSQAGFELPQPGDARLDLGSGLQPFAEAMGSLGSAGRGPTRLMSPRSTFRPAGGSSTLRARSTRPTRVTRGRAPS